MDADSFLNFTLCGRCPSATAEAGWWNPKGVINRVPMTSSADVNHYVTLSA
jgi:hypothetical protein